MAGFGLTCLRKNVFVFICLSFMYLASYSGSYCQDTDGVDVQSKNEVFKPTVLVAILIRNKAHLLPWFFGQFEVWNYPKNRMALWIRSDHNSDNSTAVVKEWLASNEHLYKSVDFVSDDSSHAYSDEKNACDWPRERFNHVISLRQQALQAARDMWADYLLMLDADVIIQNLDTLQLLIDQEKTIIAPMLNASIGETYSNFWGAVNEEGYYARVPEYFEIVERTKIGCFAVPVVHTMFLVDMRHTVSAKLSYLPREDYDVALDDIVLFSQSAIREGLSMHVLNTDYYGQVMIPLDDWNSLNQDVEQHVYIRIEALDDDNPDMSPGVNYEVENKGLRQSPHIYIPPVPKDTMGFDHIYLINLKRRPERRKRMQYVLNEMGIQAEWIEAVDGRHLNDSYLEEQGIDILPGYADPYDGRAMKMGEIGCFLSHYNIWKDVVENKYESVIVFEDDLRFEPYFKFKLHQAMKEAATIIPDWDLIYLGRKRLKVKEERYLQDANMLVWPSYSYWTLSYVLTYKAAVKLLDQKPLQKMVPVDEYLPIMFDKHPESVWKDGFRPRDLVALSVEPLLIYPTHYLGEAYYISDTEDSVIIESGDGDVTDPDQEPQGPEKSPLGSRKQGSKPDADLGKDEL